MKRSAEHSIHALT